MPEWVQQVGAPGAVGLVLLGFLRFWFKDRIDGVEKHMRDYRKEMADMRKTHNEETSKLHDELNECRGCCSRLKTRVAILEGQK